MIAVDVQPNYVRATIKGKIFQMALATEVRCSEATSKRSMITGHLLISMPKLSWTAELQFQSKQPALVVDQAKGRRDISAAPAVDYRKIVPANADDYDDVPPLV